MAIEDVDLTMVLREVVLPCLDELLRPGELRTMSLGWQLERHLDPSSLPVVSEGPNWRLRLSPEYARKLGYSVPDEDLPQRWTETTVLTLQLDLKGELFTTWLTTSDLDTFDVDQAFDEMHSDLQDFIAESSFGWGQLR